ncbi:MAG: DNA repair protein RadC [Myxococcales bacterium]|nr:DNA repair protein RadC [Myxococcales bacterium]
MDRPLSETSAAAEAAPHERPRERLWRQGSDRVSDAELLALILGTGRPGRSAAAVAHDVLVAVGGVAGLARASPHDLARVDGLGPAQAARVVAAASLGARAVERTRARGDVLRCAEDVHLRLWPRLAGLEQEVFYVVGIDARNVVVIEAEVARGHLTGVDVHPREVFRPLIRAGAAAAVCAHNHPSGDPTPSPPDLLLTERLKEAGDLLGIPVIDHVVLADRGPVSIAEWVAGLPSTPTT